jgi:transposase-like protein
MFIVPHSFVALYTKFRGLRCLRHVGREGRARADRSNGKTGLTTAEREELAKLRKENRQLKMERDLLKKWAAFFAKETT